MIPWTQRAIIPFTTPSIVSLVNVDRFLISEINLKKITSKDFVEDEGGIRFKDKSVSKFLNRWEEYKKTEIVHPLYKKKMEIKVVPYVQAQLIAEYIRGDIEEYPPIEWR